MTDIHIQRLLKLAEFLFRLPDANFYFPAVYAEVGFWLGVGIRWLRVRFVTENIQRLSSCCCHV